MQGDISLEVIQKLRALSGAGVLECKNALVETKGDVEKALIILREKGAAKALKKSIREVKNGVISSYIHSGDRMGVLIEVNCETDFVARTDEFKNLVKEVALQVAATNPQWLKIEDVPESTVTQEKEIFKKQLLDSGKPENVIDKILPGKLEKFYSEACLLEQPYVRDPQGKQKIKDLVNSVVAKTGENISIKRFVRFQLGDN